MQTKQMVVRGAVVGLAVTTIMGCSGHIGGVVDGGGSTAGSSGQPGNGGSSGSAGNRAGGTTGSLGGATGSVGGATGSLGGTSGGTGGRAGGTGGVTAGLGGAGGAVTNAGCPLFTPDDLWNADVSAAPVNANWTTRVAALLPGAMIHPDFGSDFGIPINIVPATQPRIPVTFDAYPEESDPGPYPFPAAAVAIIEGGTPTNCSDDCHLIAMQLGTCQLYEGFACHYSNGWICGNGAHWDLTKKSLGQRPDGWTSADAAGLPIYPGLARYAEYAAGEITHAIRFTLPCTSNARVPPATHQTSSCSDPNGPPMGLRMRLKATFDISTYSATAQVFLRAFKKYGLILADNGGSGSTFFFQSEVNASWNDNQINDLKRVPVTAFEAVNAP